MRNGLIFSSSFWAEEHRRISCFDKVIQHQLILAILIMLVASMVMLMATLLVALMAELLALMSAILLMLVAWKLMAMSSAAK